jgi:cell division protein FtsB
MAFSIRSKPVVSLFCLLFAVASYSPVAFAAVSDEEIRLLREQIQALSHRLDQLEQSNADLKQVNTDLAESNTRLQAASDETAQTVAQVAEAVATPDWTDRTRIKGDFRYRYENIDEEGKDPRNRNRIRARVAIISDVTDTVEVGLGFATGGDDPVSTNQTLGKGGSTKDVRLDLAYFDWTGLTNTHVMAGKYANILYKPGKNSLLWDGDWRPEGTAIAWNNGTLFANALGTWLESDSKNEEEFSYMLQAGFNTTIGENLKLTAGLGYYEFDAAGKGSFFGDDDDFFGNSFDPVTMTYLYDYQEIEAFANLGFKIGELPVGLFFDYVQNTAVDEFDTGYAVGFKLGTAKKAGSWDFGYIWQDLEADAALGLLTDSDFGGGGTDAFGHILKGSYVIANNWSAKATYFINQKDENAGDKKNFDRLQLDLSFKY